MKIVFTFPALTQYLKEIAILALSFIAVCYAIPNNNWLTLVAFIVYLNFIMLSVINLRAKLRKNLRLTLGKTTIYLPEKLLSLVSLTCLYGSVVCCGMIAKDHLLEIPTQTFASIVSIYTVIFWLFTLPTWAVSYGLAQRP